MRTFIVYRQEYSRHDAGPETIGVVQAKDLNDLARKVAPEMLVEGRTGEDVIPDDVMFGLLEECNGDGDDAFLIVELVDGKLLPILPSTGDFIHTY